MLQPRKTKYRKQQKGKMKGNSMRGNQLAFGSFGIKTLQEYFVRLLDVAVLLQNAQSSCSNILAFIMVEGRTLYLRIYANQITRGYIESLN